MKSILLLRLACTIFMRKSVTTPLWQMMKNTMEMNPTSSYGKMAHDSSIKKLATIWQNSPRNDSFYMEITESFACES